MRTAFKEWAAVIDALSQGDQALILRKGGIVEGRGGFQVRERRFWLYPTFYHDQESGLVESGRQRWLRLSANPPPAGRLHLNTWAEVVSARPVASEDVLARLRPFHCWSDAIALERFRRGPELGLWAFAARVWRTALREIEDRPEYGGCRSWIELSDDLPETPAQPAMDDAAFAERLAQIDSAWGAQP